MIITKTYEISSFNCDKDIIEIAEEIKKGYTISRIESITSIRAFWPFEQPDLKITLINEAASIT